MQQAWRIDNLDSIAGHATGMWGAPGLLRGPLGLAVRFDGVDDGLIVANHPLAGAERFTAEVIFFPESGGQPEQRFVHLQEEATEDRILFETRLTPDGQWYLDTFIESRGHRQAQLAREHLHPLDRWYHAALVHDGHEMRHYVDGRLEMSSPLPFSPPAAGRTSIGVRQNRVYHFRGAIALLRFTDEALSPEAFLRLP